MPDDEMLAGVPPEVLRVQEALAARSRLVILWHLLERPMTFAELTERIAVGATALRGGLNDLAALGYVSDDSPTGRQRKTRTAQFVVNRERVLRDVAELLVFLAH